jgi:GNAT superfamily N-acetyltransferase
MNLRWRVDRLTRADVEAGLQLSAEAGWNQLPSDWRYLLWAGQGFGVHADGRLIASSVALPYPPHFGWVSMVLVTADYRRRGLATLLLQTAVDHLHALGLVPVLDATPEGREVYSRMGFVDIGLVDRWQGKGGGAALERSAEPPARYDALDMSAFGADRRHLLDELAGRPGSKMVSSNAGFGIARQGRRSAQLGPVVAEAPAVAGELVEHLVQVTPGDIVADVPRSADAVGQLLIAKGFMIQRRFHRMALGRATGFGDAGLIQAIAGPELG